MSDNISRLPEPGVILDLDTAERDPKEIKPPFVVKVADRNITFADPSDIDWRDLAAINAPGELLRVSLTREDFDHLREAALPTWKFGRLMKSYYEHYDMEEKIREAKRQQQFAGL